jgi:uncharacterized iron-regulated protein
MSDDQSMVNCSEEIHSSQAALTPATTRRVFRPARPVFLTRYLSLFLTLVVTSGCTPVESFPRDAAPAMHSEESQQAAPLVAGETPVLDLSAYTTVEQLIPALAEKRVVFVGENHTRYDHHLIQLEIIRRLHQLHPQLAIGMEIFQQPFQAYLDDYVSGVISEQEMLRATEYYQRWRLDYRLYAPILRYAREHRLPLVALNLPVELTRKVGRVGLKGLSEEERVRIPAEIDRSDAAYEERIKEVFKYHPTNNGQEFEHFLEVQLLWDEGMAERAARFLQDNPDHHMVIVAGSGHFAYGSAIPRRLTRRLETSTAIILNNWGGVIEPGLADYLLLPAEHRLPPAGKMGAILEEEDGTLKVTACLDDSPCAAAGLQAGDRILSIDDETIDSLADLRLALWDKQPGDTIRVDILHKRWFSAGKTITYEMTLK